MKNVVVMPLNQLQKFDNTPQIIMRKLMNGHSALYIRLINGNEEYFSFQNGNRRTIKKWISTVNDLDTGQFDYAKMNDTSPDSDSLAGVVQELGDVADDLKESFTSAFGIGVKKAKPDEIKVITKKCIACGAPLTGSKGQVVQCKYCDTKQTL